MSWFKFSREILTRPAFKSTGRGAVPYFEQLGLYVYLHSNAYIKQGYAYKNGQSIQVERGQIAISLTDIEEMTGWSRAQVRGYLSRLEDHDIIGREQIGNACSLITIKKYESQPKEQRNEPIKQPTKADTRSDGDLLPEVFATEEAFIDFIFHGGDERYKHSARVRLGSNVTPDDIADEATSFYLNYSVKNPVSSHNWYGMWDSWCANSFAKEAQRRREKARKSTTRRTRGNTGRSAADAAVAVAALYADDDAEY